MENITEKNTENTPKKRNKTRIILFTLVGLLVLLNAVILYQLHSVKTEKEDTEEKLVSSENLRERLESQLSEIEMQLDEYKGRNAQLDSMISEKDAELHERAEKIRELLKEKEITTAQFNKAQKDLDVYKYYAQKYMSQIDSLDRANKELKEENFTLKEDIKKRKLESDQIKDENTKLSNKVSLGAKLSVENLSVTGVRFLRSGREREIHRAKRIDQLKICFDIGENVIADAGNRDVYVRILDPKGSVVQDAEVGMGSFGLGQKKIDYSMKKEIFYDNKAESYCMYFNKGSQFDDGVHKIEIYADEELLANTEYQIK